MKDIKQIMKDGGPERDQLILKQEVMQQIGEWMEMQH